LVNGKVCPPQIASTGDCRSKVGPLPILELKVRQANKIRELKYELVAAGFVSLDEQAKVLGLPRSTAWEILQGNYKASGLSASIVNRMLMQPRLPAIIRAKVLEYVEEKIAGVYGHNAVQRRRFSARLSIKLVASTDLQAMMQHHDR
jgi:hypothetical protein